MLNKITEFIPDEKPYVHATGYKRRSDLFGDVRDDFADEMRTVILGDKTSAYATFSANTRPVEHVLRLYGTKSVAHVDFVGRTIALDEGASLPSAFGRLSPAFSQSWQRWNCKMRCLFYRPGK